MFPRRGLLRDQYDVLELDAEVPGDLADRLGVRVAPVDDGSRRADDLPQIPGESPGEHALFFRCDPHYIPA
ncbi:hypothetical protein GCM10027445_50150 [Amycolatopsis endophytica]|uniref:Uncharacterized protein n=1 Tax=Amycolatopsis endophytica TaxID=860233 RepID=A0A853B2L7_9PSEU|nr:hypothetical protein [Amycolatopsis endophytica]NYI89054.1 hypothetical protein [Amycolatopsis endophytica]